MTQVHAEYYMGSSYLPAAFATYKMQSGFASTLAFFTFEYYSVNTQLIICLIFGVLSIPTYLMSYYLFTKERTHGTHGIAGSVTGGLVTVEAVGINRPREHSSHDHLTHRTHLGLDNQGQHASADSGSGSDDLEAITLR